MEKGLIFTYVLTYGGAVASLFNPYVGLLIYVCFAIIRPESLWFWSVPPGPYSRIVAIGLLIGWAIHGFGRWQFGRGKAVVTFLILFLVWVFLAALQATYAFAALEWAEMLSKTVLPFVVGMTIIDSVVKLKQLAWVIVLSHGYVAYDLNRAYYAGFNRIQQIGFGGMDNNCVAITMVCCAGLALFLGLTAPRWWQKAIALAATGLMLHCVLFAYSRGGMLGLIIMAVVSFLLIPKKPLHYLLFALMVALTLRLAGPQVVARFTTIFADERERDGSAQSRVEMWQTCLQLMARNPVFGIGSNHFSLTAKEHGYSEGKEAHSLWLQVGAETGVVGLFFLVGFYGVCVVRLWPLTRERCAVADPWFRDSARMVIASLAGFAVSAQFVSLAGLEAPYYVVLLGAGALKLGSLPTPATVQGQTAPAQLAQVGAPAGALVQVGWTTHDSAHLGIMHETRDPH
jgi:probable O-glycosylation ligase (exosortase A-associated)